MQQITPCLWFDDQAEEAMKFYVEVWSKAPHTKEGSKIVSIARYEEGMETPENEKRIGKVITGIFELAGQKFMALDGGPVFKFSEAISFQVECEDQQEVDYFWEKLSAVPDAEQCGWLKDKYGLSWQIVPRRLEELLKDSDQEKRLKVINKMLKMKKIIVEDLE